MSINLGIPQDDITHLKPRITVVGVGGAGGNAVNNMIASKLEGVDFVVANTDAQALSHSRTDRRIQLGADLTQGLGAGARPEIGQHAAEESLDSVMDQVRDSHMTFITAGMGGGTGTGAAPVIAQAAREAGILTVGVVTRPFDFEGPKRRRLADAGIEALAKVVDTLIIIPNQNLFRIANEKTTFADAFKMADDVLNAGVRSVTDLMINPGLINLDFADVRTVMDEMGKAMMGTGEAEGENRALEAAERAINNPLLEDISMAGATGVLINVTGGEDMTLYEADEAANRIKQEVDQDANIIFGACFDPTLEGRIRVSVVATGIQASAQAQKPPRTIDLVKPKAPAVPEIKAPEPVAAPAPAPKAETAPPLFAMATARPAAQVPAAPPQQPVATAPEPVEAPAAPAEPKVDEANAFIPGKPAETPRRPALANDGVTVEPGEAKDEAVLSAQSRDRAAKGFLDLFARSSKRPAREPAPVQSLPARTSTTVADPSDRVMASVDDEEDLEIPAFLRRQAN